MWRATVTYQIDIPDGYRLASDRPVILKKGEYGLSDEGHAFHCPYSASTGKYFRLEKKASSEDAKD